MLIWLFKIFLQIKKLLILLLQLKEMMFKTIDILKNNKNIDYKNIIHNDKVAKVSIVGAGMVSTPGVTYRMFRALSEEKINILAISTSEIKFQ